MTELEPTRASQSAQQRGRPARLTHTEPVEVGKIPDQLERLDVILYISHSQTTTVALSARLLAADRRAKGETSGQIN